MAKTHNDLLVFLESQRGNLEAVAKMLPKVPDEMTRLAQDIQGVIVTAAYTAAELRDVCNEVHALRLAEDRKSNDEILRWISPLEPSKRHQDVRSLRLDGTCRWILQHPLFLDWCSDTPTNRVLGCFGNPGAGKTITASRVIDELLDRSQKAGRPETGLAYVYCDYRDQSQQTIINLVGAVLKQLVMPLQILPEEIIACKKECKQRQRLLELSDASTLLRSACGIFKQTYICFDAIDECKDVNQLLKFLQNMPHSVRLFMTGRKHIQRIVQHYFGETLSIPIEANEDDIRALIESMIAEDRIQDSDIMDEKLEKEITEKIVAFSKGMFLLPALHIRIVLDARTKWKRRLALKTLPAELDDAFSSTIQRVKQQSKDSADQAMQVLMWIHLAERPLSVDELLHALAIDTNYSDLHWDNFPSRRTFLDCCLGLVIIDDETSTVRLVHYSLQEYLKNQGQLFSRGHQRMAEICLTYLMTAEGRVELESESVIEPSQMALLDYAACQWGHHARKGYPLEESTVSLMRRYLSMDACDRWQSDMCLRRDIRKKDINIYDHRTFPLSFSSLHIAAHFGIHQVLSDNLLPASTTYLGDKWGHVPLLCAVWNGHDILVKLLLEKGAQLESRDQFGRTPLSLAAAKGEEAVVKLLLEKGAELESKDHVGYTPLSLAAIEGDEAVVKLLLEKGAEVESKSISGQTPLSLAAIYGREVVVKLLLEKGTELESKSISGHTPLSLAALTGRETVVKLLLEEGAELESKSIFGHTPLSLAALNGWETVMKLLLEKGAKLELIN